MKRYKDCELICNEGQSSDELLDIVEQVSKAKRYKIERYSAEKNNDTLAVYIQKQGLPYSRLVMWHQDGQNAIPIINIVPMQESGISHIDFSIYNQLLNSFRDDVFAYIKEKYGNEIVENSEEYTIQEIIPITFEALNTWLSAYPLSGHPLDIKRWNAFVVSLHESGEELSLDDFEKYIKEKYSWDEDVLLKFSMKLESELELLKYYDEHRTS